ncbi:thiamine biosynthesis protein ThiJ [Francisella tularensis]|nr:thiamine biosynthesis protein ThiJ [Francisella tularensis]
MGVIGAICHGVAALINVKDNNGQNIIRDKEVTGFSNNEEKIVGLTDVVPFSLEDSLVEAGAKYSIVNPKDICRNVIMSNKNAII